MLNTEIVTDVKNKYKTVIICEARLLEKTEIKMGTTGKEKCQTEWRRK
jgi:hypothetical protein